jgi:acetylglutamate kinase
MKRLFVIKIGGQVLDDHDQTSSFLRDFAAIDARKILVHGGGKIATRIGEQLGIVPHYVEGRRITDEPTRDLVTMVYGGLVNKMLVSQLQALGCNALGLTGADGKALAAVRRPVTQIDYGFVGDVVPGGVNTALLEDLLDGGVTPVFAPLTLGNGEILNTNADTIASTLAIAFGRTSTVRLIFCFDKKGVLSDVHDGESVIPHLTENSYASLRQSRALADGILPKLENAFATIHAGVSEVLIGDAKDLLKNTGKNTMGTLITA